MSRFGLRSFLGLDARPYRWERSFLLVAALVVSDVIVFTLGYAQRWSAETGFTVSLFVLGPPRILLTMLVGNLLRVLLVILFLRFVRREGWALLLAALAIGLASEPVGHLLRGVLGLGWGAAVWRLGGVVSATAGALGFFVCLSLALGALRRPLAGLLVGGVAGSVVGLAAAEVGAELVRTHAQWGLAMGFLVRGVPRELLFGALFAPLLWAGLRASGSLREEPGPVVRRALFTGTFISAGAILVALWLAVRLCVVLGVWARPTFFGDFARDDARTVALSLTLLGRAALVIAAASAVVLLRFVYRIWAAIQDGHARTTPGRAVGFLFIPLFNLYWVFQVWAGFASDFNAVVRRRGLAVPALRPGLFAAFIVLAALGAVPYLEIAAVASFVLGVLQMRRVGDGVNALAAAGAAG
jgi:hypothetical protein